MRPLQLCRRECSVKFHRNGTIFQKRVQLLTYAEDIDIIGRIKRDVTAAFSSIKRESIKIDLAVNEGKAKYIVTK